MASATMASLTYNTVPTSGADEESQSPFAAAPRRPGRTRASSLWASVAAAAGVNVCIHGLHETGITTCAANHAAAVIHNLDDGNQYMNHLLSSDLISNPDLTLQDGRLPVLSGPGFGFEIDLDAVGRASEDHRSTIIGSDN